MAGVGQTTDIWEWLEKCQTTYIKRECCRIVTTQKDKTRCCCGRSINNHNYLDVMHGDKLSHMEENEWSSTRDTKMLETDAYGVIDFQGGSAHPNKAQVTTLIFL